MSPGCLSIKIFSLDYYFSLPNDLLDIGYSKFARCYSHRIPVIRVYGTTHTGQKICANVHGVLPYIFIELPNVDSDLDDFVQSFVLSLEKSIRTKLSTPNVKDVIVFDASVVSGLEYLSPDSIPKCTSMELEVDISAWDILNRRDLQDNLSINPGLEAMWHEEKMRRASNRDIPSERLPEMPTSDELLPTKQSGVVDLSTSEMHYLTQWTNLLCDQHTSLEVEQDINYTGKFQLLLVSFPYQLA
ncbi:DNA polymerase zeta catalytic subunit, putative [Schistosoma mansoni]|uniref:DNA polymerase zeta catalytic subunit, putative n=1 Tax=Schistosoma mansoni TaxID=6183 RepID=UPI00022C857C|nr:DNA polymerase zeta catalytic subunit, putative [Schistosoma mansoni]|eukprot:XP_018646534.1 DNA polymerase zeta catalytic subunit, putative [Schistosoma mansoni]